MNQELALNLFQYKDGKLFWKVNPVHWRNLKNTVAGAISNNGYINIKYQGKGFKAHRIVYMMHYGDIPKGKVMDHLNGDRTDNRIENLRCTTSSENNRNRKTAKGYCWDKEKKKYLVSFGLNKKSTFVGRYGTECGARLAYLMRKLQWNLSHIQ